MKSSTKYICKHRHFGLLFLHIALCLIQVSSFLRTYDASTRRSTTALSQSYDEMSKFKASSKESSTNSNGFTKFNGNKQHTNQFHKLQEIMTSPPISYPAEICDSIISLLMTSGFIDDNDVTNFAKGFLHREEILSQILIQDFQFDVLDAHRVRVSLIELVSQQQPKLSKAAPSLVRGKPGAIHTSTRSVTIANQPKPNTLSTNIKGSEDSIESPQSEDKRASWKSVLVNDKAKMRRDKNKKEDSDSTNNKNTYSYGLSTTDGKIYPTLFEELDSYWCFMTIPQTSLHAEPPIRERTAEVYRTHAKLFLGWILDNRTRGSVLDIMSPVADDEPPTASKNTQSSLVVSSSAKHSKQIQRDIWRRVNERYEPTCAELTADAKENELKRIASLIDIFPDTSTSSAACVLNYILWLRTDRDISANYEANILRGLIKLVKFRFATTLSDTDHSPSNKSATPLDDLSIVKELRRLHRDAGHKAKKSQRSSDEGKKWLEWDEYLDVIEMLKKDLLELIECYDSYNESNLEGKDKKKAYRMKKEIATAFQQYLVLSFFASVPDRQRTFRELELGRSFLRIDGINNSDGQAMWVIKHTADDYKTGSTYGERPPLPLSGTLTPFIDDFLERWRPALLSESNPSSSFLFLQPRTGNPLTPNSIYQIVSRCCYKYKQKKTNPHLLRDMIVTHIRKNSDASEKELEALALFMGHSVSMQRESYDRRTLEQKIEPAIQIMQQITMPEAKRGNTH